MGWAVAASRPPGLRNTTQPQGGTSLTKKLKQTNAKSTLISTVDSRWTLFGGISSHIPFQRTTVFPWTTSPTSRSRGSSCLSIHSRSSLRQECLPKKASKQPPSSPSIRMVRTGSYSMMMAVVPGIVDPIPDLAEAVATSDRRLPDCAALDAEANMETNRSSVSCRDEERRDSLRFFCCTLLVPKSCVSNPSSPNTSELRSRQNVLNCVDSAA